MKKNYLITFFIFCFFVNSLYGQEVRGIESRWVTYQGSTERICDGRNSRGDFTFTTSNTWCGIEFRNMNSIPVSVDLSLYDNEHDLLTTKSITLKPGESYIWKHENRMHFCMNWREGFINYTDHKTTGDVQRRYYVKYEAFKLQ